MSLRTALNRDFRVLDADEERAAALATATASRAGHFIVRKTHRPDVVWYWVLEREDVLKSLRELPAARAGDALRLYARAKCPAVAATALASPGSTPQVALAGQIPIGFIAAALVSRSGGASPAFAPVAAVGPRQTVFRGGSNNGDARPAAFTRELNASWPDCVAAGSPIALLVSLASLGADAARTGPLQLEAGARIGVVVRPLEGVTLDSSNTGTLVVSDPQPDEPLIFQLTAGPAGHGAVRIYAFSAGRSVASIQMATSIVKDGEAPAEPEPLRASATVPASPRIAPDLSLLVIEGGNEIRYRLQAAKAGVGDKDYPPVPFTLGSREYFAQFAHGIENLAVDSEDQRNVARKKVELWGVDLFQKLLPAELKATLWELRARIGTVQITSDEAWIPWEVCRLLGRDAQGRNVEGEFFAEAFCVTRWLHGAAAPERFRFGDWALVVPKDSRLPLAAKEEAYILSLGRADRRVTQVAARFADVTAAMESERFHAWHFCGHAHSGDNLDGDKAAIELENREALTADLFTGRVENALRTGPFMFLNACQSAQGGLTLTGVGGWAHRFIRPSFDRYAASAFIGSYWSVYDNAAHGFATGLYDRLLHAGQPIGQAVREARLAVRTKEDPLTWLAYTVYADPLATAEKDEHETT